MNYYFQFLVIILLLYRRLACVEQNKTCEVTVDPPWEMMTFVPRCSSTYIRCTPTSQDQTLWWSIKLATSENFSPVSPDTQTTVAGSIGFYSILQNHSAIIVVLVNGSVNGISIKCIDQRSEFESFTLYETTLSVYEPASVTFNLEEIEGLSINISWSTLPISENNQTYTVTIKDSNHLLTISRRSQPYFVFTAPEDAPPCEVYNFSVTATYVGATYTGAGCSVPSSINTMLPSLPDTKPLESSIQYILMKEVMKIILNVTFNPAQYCEEYPVHNYTLEVKGQSSEVLSNSTSPQMQNSIIIHNLTENTIYSFRVLVSNSVGVVSINRRQFYVQNVTAKIVETMNTVVVQCDFITGSNAKGCMVVLVGEFGNITQTLNITNSCKMEIFNSTDPITFHEVFAFDIESEGSIGTLAVPGVISNNLSEAAACPSTTTTATIDNAATYTTEKPNTVVIAIGCSLGAVIILICICMIISIAIGCKVKRSKKGLMVVQPLKVYLDEPDTNCSELAHCTDKELEIQEAEIFYDQPVKARERCSGDGAEYGKTKHIKDHDDITAVEREMNTYAEIVEENHHYHTLEPQRAPQDIKVGDIDPDPDAPALPPPYRPPSPSLEQPPLYQEISSLQVGKYDQERDTTNGEIVNDQYQSSPNQPPSGEAQVSSETVL